MIKRIIKYIVLVFVVMQTSVNFAQTFVATVSHSKIGLDDQFDVSFTFTANNVNNLKNFSPPDLSNF